MSRASGEPRTLWPLLAAILLTGIGHTARADTDWSGPLFGSWFTPGNWTAGIPDSSDVALIDTGLAAVESNASIANAQGLIVGGTNTGSTAGLGISSNTLNTKSVTVGRDIGSSGIITVGTNGQLEALSGSPGNGLFTIGQSGIGSVLISSNGQVVARQVTIGEFAGSSGSLIVNGGSFQTLAFFGAELAPAGSASITVTSGGRFESYSFVGDTIGRNGGIATISVSGTNSRLIMPYTEVISASTFNVSSGGSMEFTTVGNHAGIWSIEAGGSLTVTDTLQLQNDSKVTLELGGTAANDRGILSARHLILDGSMTIELVNGFQPSLGNSFSILSNVEYFYGSFEALTLPALNPGLNWDSANLYTTGVITVVPEPATCTLIPVFAGALAFRRRRKPTPHFSLP